MNYSTIVTQINVKRSIVQHCKNITCLRRKEATPQPVILNDWTQRQRLDYLKLVTWMKRHEERHHSGERVQLVTPQDLGAPGHSRGMPR